MMSKYFLIKEKSKSYNIGDIVTVNWRECKEFEAKQIELKFVEADFYRYFKKDKRIVAYKNGLYDKISNLLVGDKVFIKLSDEEIRATITSISSTKMRVGCQLSVDGKTKFVETEKIEDIKYEMPDYFIVEENYDKLNGEIVEGNNKKKVKVFDGKENNFFDIERVKTIKLSLEEANFYRKLEKNKRVRAYNNHFYDKFNQLEIGTRIRMRIDKNNYLVTVKNVQKNDMSLVVELENGKSKVIELSKIDDFDILNKEKIEEDREGRRSSDVDESMIINQKMKKDGYYLVLKNRLHMKEGTIIRAVNGVSKIHPDNIAIENIDDWKDSLEQIDSNEISFLINYSIDKRIRKHGTFSKIKQLEIGQKCYMKGMLNKNVLCLVTKKDIQNDGIKFDLEAEDNQRREHKGIDASKIRLFERDSMKNTDSVNVKNKEKSSFKSQESLVYSSLGSFQDISKNDLKTVLYEPLGVDFINPQYLSDSDISSGEQLKKMLVLHHTNKYIVVTLLWSGMFENKKCLGCELLIEWSKGTNGTFNNSTLFKCDDNKGVLIPFNASIETCEFGNSHIELNELEIIDDRKICCVETTESLASLGDEGEKTMIWKTNKNVKGKLKWRGLINGKECAGLIIDSKIAKLPSLSKKSWTIVNEMKLFCTDFSNVIILHLENVDEEKLHWINNSIVDSSRIYSVNLVKKNNEQEINIGDPVTMAIKDNDGKDKECVGEVKWIGLINNDKECVGVDMEDEFEYGMDGTLINDIKFECIPKHGLITLLSNVKLYKYDKKLELLDNGLINPNKYIKYEDIRNQIEYDKTYKINDTVFILMNTPNKKHKMKGTLKRRGMMNGILVGVVELNEDHASGTNGRFWRQKLINTREMRTVAVLPCNIVQYSTIKFDEKCFVANSYRFNDAEILIQNEKYNVGHLLKAKTKPVLYGEIAFFVRHCGKKLVGMRLDESQLRKHRNILQSKLVGKPHFKEGDVGIIVKEKILDEMEGIEYMKNSKIIDMDSVKYSKKEKSNKFHENDIVKLTVDESQIFKVTNLFQLNGIACLEVTEAILPSKKFYVKERDVCQIEKPKIDKSIFEGILINPFDITTFERYQLEDGLKEGHNVEFRSNDSSKLYKGIVLLIGKIEGVLCCVVELTSNVNKEIESRYIINKNKSLNKLCRSGVRPTVIALSNILHKDIKVLSDGIYVLNNQFITKTKGSKVEEKVMILKYENEKRLLKLKWKGIVDKMSCLGCEMKNETEYGTNGYFGREQLFECRDKYGVLIHIDDLEECCEQIGHNRLSKNNYNMIDEDCICCMKSVEKLNGNYQMKINCLVERMKNEYLTCKWIGLVNDVEVIGAEFKCTQPCGTDGTFCGIKLFDCPDKCGGLFEASEFTIAELEKTYLSDFHLNIILPYSITSIENGRKIRKSIILEAEKKVRVINLRWRGCIKGHLCVGVELNKKTELGTDGMFNGEGLFKCGDKNGVLVHVDDLKETCEFHFKHQEIFLSNNNLAGYLFGYIKSVNPDYICCVEWLDKIKAHPNLQIGSSVKYKKDGKDIDGTCEWIGSINGREAIGARMDCKSQGFNGTFNSFELFICPNGSGFLFLAEDMHHDKEKDKLYFIKNTIVDSSRIYSAKVAKQNREQKINIGDPVTMTIDGQDKEYVGEVKWIGLINNDKECVGVDMEDEFEYGMDGRINEDIRFACLPKHGLITLLSNVKLYKYDKILDLLENGIINPNKYIKWDGIKNQIEFDETYKINDTVFVRMNTPNKKHKMKGTLKRRGMMNGILVGVVELNEDHASGTNGRFWRQKLIDTREKRTVAILFENIDKYIPYEFEVIPLEKRIFKNIDLNSAVIYYYPSDKELISLYGTVRWSGIDENNEYFYGIELDDRSNNGTDGTFKCQRLFQCRNGHGVLASINHVALDSRFTEIVVTPDNITKSEESKTNQLGVLIKLSNGLNKGIQGNANSCYFDSAIFALFVNSDVLDFMISPMINKTESDEITKQFRDIMAWKIIYPLRQYGFVSFHRTEEMREIIKQYGPSFAEMTKQETDMGNVSILLSKFCPKEQLLKIVSQNQCQTNSMFMQLFITLKNKSKYMTSEEMINLSMIQNGIMFEEHPMCLIAQAPRDARGINCYDFVLPSDIIEISNICSNNWKKCNSCEKEAIFQCSDCIEENKLDIRCGFRCKIHSCRHKEKIELNKQNGKSRSKVFMELKAIICIEKCHFVSYVKQVEMKTSENIVKKWFFFDSMSTQSGANNYAIPNVFQADNVTHFMNQPFEDMKNDIECYKTTDLKRIIKDSYVFIYHNSAKTCY